MIGVLCMYGCSWECVRGDKDKGFFSFYSEVKVGMKEYL